MPKTPKKKYVKPKLTHGLTQKGFNYLTKGSKTGLQTIKKVTKNRVTIEVTANRGNTINTVTVWKYKTMGNVCGSTRVTNRYMGTKKELTQRIRSDKRDKIKN